MDDHRRQLSQGFGWLGGATILAKLVDTATMLAVLLLLTKQQVGTASLVISIGMIVEAFNGLGTSEALLQARSVSRVQLDTLFWYVTGAAIVVSALTLLAAPWVQSIYASPVLAGYFVAIAVKQPMVGAALIPLAMLNRELRYKRIAIVNLSATFAAAITRLTLAASGAGAWALVGGYVASGFYILVGAAIAWPFWPRWNFRVSAIQPLARFGTRASAANVIEQIFKNVDYLLVGWFYGTANLAVYRVAFDIAMEPAMAVGTLVNRTALPVFAKAASAGGPIAEILTWALRRVAVLVAPLMVGIILAADQLTALLHDDNGHSYAASATPLKVFAAAALLRIVSQLLPPVMLATGRPGMAARVSAVTFLLLTTGIVVVGITLPAAIGVTTIAAVWLGVYPPLLVWGFFYLRRWRLQAVDFARALILPLLGTGLLAAMVKVAGHVAATGNPKVQLAIVGSATALTYFGLFWRERHRSP